MTLSAMIERAVHKVRAGRAVFAVRDAERAERARERDIETRATVRAIERGARDIERGVERELVGYRAVSPELLRIVSAVVARVARLYPGLCGHDIEQRVLSRIAQGLVVAPTTEPRRIAGRARFASHRVARRLRTGRGAMPWIYDAERVEGSPNYASWVALDETGHVVVMGDAGTTAGYLAARDGVPGERDIEQDIDQLPGHLRDAVRAVYENTYTYSRERATVARGSVVVRWHDAHRDYIERGHDVSRDTMRRRAVQGLRDIERGTYAVRRDARDIEYPILPAPIVFTLRGPVPVEHVPGHDGNVTYAGYSDHWNCVSGRCARCDIERGARNAERWHDIEQRASTIEHADLARGYAVSRGYIPV